MYNPYLEEEEFVALGEQGNMERMESMERVERAENVVGEDTVHQIESILSSPLASAVIDEVVSEGGKFASLKNLLKMKDLAGDFGGIFGKKEKIVNSTKSNLSKSSGPSFMEKGESEGEEGLFSSVKRKLKLESLEAGDVLLVVIVVYLMLEGDDKLELAITLGILAFLWWSDKKGEED